MRLFSLTLMLGFAASPAFATPQQDYRQPLNEQYKSCTQMAAANPQETLIRARKWFEESKQLAAQHCLALAQFELKHFADAAITLETILRSVDRSQGALWYSMKKQVVRAYMNSGHAEDAERHLSDALRYASEHNLEKEMPPMLLERARIYSARNEHLRAIQDIDHALTLDNGHPVMLERANVYMKMGDTTAAERDIRAVLKADPLNEEASKMLGALERRIAELKEEAAAKATANIPAPVHNNYYAAPAGGSSAGGGGAAAAPERKLSFDERVAQHRAERAAKYGRSGGLPSGN